MRMAFARTPAGNAASPATTSPQDDGATASPSGFRTRTRAVRERARSRIDAALDRLDEMWDDEALVDGWSGYCCFRHSADVRH